MEYSAKLNEYGFSLTENQVKELVMKARELAVKNENVETYKFCYSTIDLTSLNECDNDRQITEFTRKTVELNDRFPDMPNVASICVFPIFVDTVGVAIGDSNMKITSVAGGFPASQTYLEVKMLEIAMAIENGANEIDIVINVGQMLTGEYDKMANDIEMMRSEIEDGVVLKVIIESGALKTAELIGKASLLSMMAGADFVKTSTGKISVAATPESAVIMCSAIKAFYDKTGTKVGFKAAGGVRTPEDAALYYTIIEMILGKEWLTPKLFRIGASSAANNLLSAITGTEVKYY